MKAAITIGAATPPGRLARALNALAAQMQAEGDEVEVVDLPAVPLEACDGRPHDDYGAATRAAVGALAAADLVILGAPVYRATYPGVLKNLLDITPIEALLGKPVGIVAMGGSLHHYLGVDSALRQVLAWFGALATPASVYLTPASFAADGTVEPQALAEISALASTARLLAERVAGAALDPPPLAARGPLP